MKGEKMNWLRAPDPKTEPDEEKYITADCGDEVYVGEYLYVIDGKTYCPNCAEEEINSIGFNELVERLGGEVKLIEDVGA